jgi:aminopeptidase N
MKEMLEKLTQGERAELEKYNTDLAAEIAAMDDTELGLLAKRADVDASKYPKRDDLIAAIKEKASADFAAGKVELREMAESESQRVMATEEARPASARIIRALNASFCRDMPEEARAGAYEPTADEGEFGGEYAVANGIYRVLGSEWVFEIKGKRLIRAFNARPENKWGGDKVVQVD